MNQKISLRKIAPALGIVLISLGGLLWQMNRVAERVRVQQAEAQAAAQANVKPTHWHEAPPQLRMAIAATVRGQSAAIKRGDMDAATDYLSADLRKRFASAAEFGQALESAHPQLARHQKISFFFVNTDPAQRRSNAGIRLTVADDVVVEAVYHLVLEEGQWRVSGVSNGRTTTLNAVQST